MSLNLRTDDRSVAAAIVDRFPGDPYVAFHSPRYATVLKLVEQHLEPLEKRVLDIGPSALTELVRDQFRLPVDTLGFTPDRRTDRGNHYVFDLNEAQWPERWRRDLPLYDLVIMAEVIEHLHASPRLVLAFLRTLMRPGGVLIIQTPNAVRFGTRLKVLVGRNPYAMIREDVSNPDHFREYTERELRDYVLSAGLNIQECIFSNYFDIRHGDQREGPRISPLMLNAMNVLYQAMPPSLRTGLTVVARNNG